MANFNGLVLTTAGANLLDKVATAGATLQFTRAAMGDGVWPQGTDPVDMTGLVSERQSLDIQGLADTGDGQHKISVQMTNTGLAEGFLVREIGVFADDPDEGEILYQVAYAEQPDYLPPDGGATHIEMVTDLLVVTSSATNVTAIMDGSLVFAHVTDLAEHEDSYRGFAHSGQHEQYTGDLDVIERNSLYAITRENVQHAPADMPAGVQGFVQTMVQPEDAGRTQLIWSVDDADHPGWWRRRANDAWGVWRVVGGSDGVPVGAIMPMAGRATPAGYLRCNGVPFLCSTYPQLTEALYCGDELNPTAVAGYRFTDTANPDGSRAIDGAYMLLPELRGEFVRGLDEDRWVDVGREHGSAQADALQGFALRGSFVNVPNAYAESQYSSTNTVTGGVPGGTNTILAAIVSDGTNGTPRITSETRPRNVAFPYVIKAFGAALNASYVDMAALASEVARLSSGSGQGGGIPVGTVLWVPGTTALPGMLAINAGASVSRTTWPDLWTYVQSSGMLITEAEWQAQAAVQSSVGYFSDGDGATTFRLPRIVDYLRGADPSDGRGVGAWQEDEVKAHTHGLTNASRAAQTGGGYLQGANGPGSLVAVVPTDSTGGTENRPKSINWLPCIQAASVPVYSGTVDMLSLASEVTGLEGSKVAFSDFAQDFSGSGWVQLPNGLILQWGIFTSNAGGNTVSFPIAFPNSALRCVITPGLGSYTVGLGNATKATVVVYTYDSATKAAVGGVNNNFYVIGY